MVAGLVLVDAADEWFSYLPASAAPQIRDDLGLSYAQLGVLLVLLPAGGMLGNVTLVAADFVSRRVIATSGALTYAGCLAVFALGDSFAVLAIASFVWGAASDAFVHGAGLALADLAGDDIDATLAGKDLMGSIGTIASPACVAIAAMLGIGWRPLFGGGAVVMALFAVWLARQPLPAPAAVGHTPWSALRGTVRDPRVWRMTVVLLLWDTIEAPFLGLAAASLVTTNGYSEGAATLLVGTWTLGATLAFGSMLLWPPRGESTMRRAALLRCAAILAMAIAGAPVVVGFAAFVVGASGARFWVPYQSEVLRLRPDQRGTTWAVIAGLSIPGLAIPPLLGTLADWHGSQVALFAFALMPVLTLAVLLKPALPRLPAWLSSRRSSGTSAGRSRRPIS
ncbi:MAG: MFS transporter [Acidimicrobiia bacterium]